MCSQTISTVTTSKAVTVLKFNKGGQGSFLRKRKKLLQLYLLLPWAKQSSKTFE